MTKKKSKTPTSRSAKNAVPEPQLPSLVEAMMKIADRLEALERKMDSVLGKIGSIQNARQESFGQQRQNFNTHHHSQGDRQHRPQNHQNNYNQNQGTSGQNYNQGGQAMSRSLYPATCADCGVRCEVPFKPTGERPTYCKECFAKRKSGGNNQGNQKPGSREPFSRPQLQPRLVKVTPNGVGKVTISEMVPPARKSKGKAKSAKKR